jgi:hypothetical protein
VILGLLIAVVVGGVTAVLVTELTADGGTDDDTTSPFVSLQVIPTPSFH